MFGIDAIELVLLIVLAVIMFGPEKLPVFARKAAQMFVAVRDMANNAQTQLRSELGPEFSDLEIKDLNPKSFVKKHMSAEIAAVEEARRELSLAKTTVQEAATQASQETAEARAALKDSGEAVAAVAAPEPAVIFDVEAT